MSTLFCENLCFFAGEDFAVLVWLDIIALGRYTVFIAAGSCEGVGAPDLFYRIKLCQRRRADCMGFVRLFDFRRNLHEDFVF